MSQSIIQRREDGRWLVVGRAGQRNYFWYRVVMWNELGRELRSDELVHHINGDPSDDRVENLTIVSRGEHQQLHHAIGTSYAFTPEDRARAKAKIDTQIDVVCSWCGRQFKRGRKRVSQVENPSCSRSCAAALRAAGPLRARDATTGRWKAAA